MSENHFKLVIATPAALVRDAEGNSPMDCVYLVVPGIEGYLGIMAHHAPFMTAIDIGTLTWRDTAGYDHIFAVTNGFLEVSDNVATIIADSAEMATQIDLERAKRALERAQMRLNRAGTDPSVDAERTRAAYRRALNRIKIASSFANNHFDRK